MDYGAKLLEPIYPLAYAATLAGLDAATARRWTRGYSYKHNGKQKQSDPYCTSRSLRREPTLS